MTVQRSRLVAVGATLAIGATIAFVIARSPESTEGTRREQQSEWAERNTAEVVAETTRRELDVRRAREMLRRDRWEPGLWLDGQLIEAADVFRLPRLEVERLAGLHETVRVYWEARSTLDTALEEGRIAEAWRDDAVRDRFALTVRMVEGLLSLEWCDAGRRHLDEALTLTTGLAAESLVEFSHLEASIRSCQERVSAREYPWDAREYVELLRFGEVTYEKALMAAETDVDQSRTLLYESLLARREALMMVQQALNNDTLRPPDRSSAERDLCYLYWRVLSTLRRLELEVAFHAQREELERQLVHFSEEERAELTEAIEALAADVASEDGR